MQDILGVLCDDHLISRCAGDSADMLMLLDPIRACAGAFLGSQDHSAMLAGKPLNHVESQQVWARCVSSVPHNCDLWSMTMATTRKMLERPRPSLDTSAWSAPPIVGFGRGEVRAAPSYTAKYTNK